MGASQENSLHFQWGEVESVTHEVVRAVAETSGKDPTEIDPVATQVDPDALDALFAPGGGEGQRTKGHVRFTVAGYDVTVYAHGEVVVYE